VTARQILGAVLIACVESLKNATVLIKRLCLSTPAGECCVLKALDKAP
jgi:hypothetical protein